MLKLTLSNLTSKQPPLFLSFIPCFTIGAQFGVRGNFWLLFGASEVFFWKFEKDLANLLDFFFAYPYYHYIKHQSSKWMNRKSFHNNSFLGNIEHARNKVDGVEKKLSSLVCLPQPLLAKTTFLTNSRGIHLKTLTWK